MPEHLAPAEALGAAARCCRTWGGADPRAGDKADDAARRSCELGVGLHVFSSAATLLYVPAHYKTQDQV